MILASIEGTIFAVVITLVMVVVRWISERKAQNQVKEADRQNPVEGGRAAASKRDSEEERMRRFMEALGIPSDGTPPAPSPPPMRQPPPRRETTIRPVPPIVVGERPTRPARPPSAPPPMPTVRRQVAPPPAARPFVLEEPASESAPAPATSAGRIQLPELQTPEVEEFRTTTSSISALPEEVTNKRGLPASPAAETTAGRAKGGELWREALRSPDALRSAYILKEILGTPRGLQSVGGVHSFPTL